MTIVDSKYLKDEQGNIISLITGIESVVGGNLHPTLLDILHPF